MQEFIPWFHNIQHNDAKHNNKKHDIQHNDNQRNGIPYLEMLNCVSFMEYRN